MIWKLTYKPATDRAHFTEPHTIRWVTGTEWTEPAIVEDFERRHAGAKVLSLEPTEVLT
jgi:hypothetical protein